MKGKNSVATREARGLGAWKSWCRGVLLWRGQDRLFKKFVKRSKNWFSGHCPPPKTKKIGQFFDEKCNLASSGDGKEAFQGSHYTIKRLWRNLNRQGRLESQNCSRSSFPSFLHFYPVLLGRWSNMLGLVWGQFLTQSTQILEGCICLIRSFHCTQQWLPIRPDHGDDFLHFGTLAEL